MRFHVFIGLFLGVLAVNFANGAENLASRVGERVNHCRAEHRLPALAWNDDMATLAREHSRRMASGTIGLGHNNASKRFEILREKIPGLESYGENVAYQYEGDGLTERLVSHWIKSSDHRENILGEFTHTGIGVCRDGNGRVYVTQIFGRVAAVTQNAKSNDRENQLTIFKSRGVLIR